MFSIIVRDNGANHYATVESLTSAHGLFHALTKTFKVVELWQGTTLVSAYSNTSGLYAAKWLSA
jgi:hypothetical protein